MKTAMATAAVFLCTAAAYAQSLSVRPLQSLENHLLYHPSTAAQSWLSLPAGIRVVDVWLRSSDGQTIHAWWLPDPHGGTGAVLLCHGNAGNLSHWSVRGLQLQAQLQRSVLIFDYPGYGRSSGKPSEPGCYAAADAAFDWLASTAGVRPEEIILYGESLGGGAATELAVRRSARALVLVRTFTCVPDVVRGSWLSSMAPLVRNRFDNLARIPQCTMPIFIAHGDRDTVIPLEHGVKLYEAAPQPRRGHLLKNLGHNDDLPADFYEALAQFLRENRAAQPAVQQPN